MPKRSTKINFTKQALARIKPPTDQDRLYVYDKRLPGLAVCVTRTGSRTFYVYRRARGRPVRVRLGRFPEVTIEQARRQTSAVLAEIARGRDPQEEKRTLRRQCTLGELFEHYREVHAKPHCREKTRAEDRRMFDKHLSTWRARRISLISSADVAALHGRIGAKRPYMANKLLGLLSRLFNHGRRTLRLTMQNPCEGIRKFPEQQRERFLDADELGQFFEALAGESEPFRTFFLILLLTGARRGNVQAMKWADVDLDRGIWRISHTESKNRAAMLVVLSPEVVGLLQRLSIDADGSEYVFPSRGRTGHLIEPKSAWKRILARAGLTDCRMHDLRRTLGSWQAAGGTSLPIIGKTLGHKSISTTQIYARLSVDPVRQSVDRTVAEIVKAANGSEIINGGERDDE
ncbi:MAG: tyrosine-type recombinase/integrase [Planctomycetota bacterium]|jgi:integrase